MEPLIGRPDDEGGPRGIGPKRPLPRGAMIAGLVVVAALAYGGLATREDRDDAGVPVLRIEDAVVSEGDEQAAGYLTVVNEGGGDQLVAVDTNVAGQVSVHHSEERDGVVVMVPASSLGNLAEGVVIDRRPAAIGLTYRCLVECSGNQRDSLPNAGSPPRLRRRRSIPPPGRPGSATRRSKRT